jgi:DNA-binding IclR family transcriptional regulator
LSDPEAEKSPVLKALRLLSHVAQCYEPVMLADLSRAVRLPKPTSYRLATMLERAGYMRKDPLTLRYSIGPKFEDIALAGLRNGGAGAGRRSLMDALAKRVRARVNFVVMRGGELLNIAWVESTSAIRVDVPRDLLVEVQCSASGKLLLAHSKDEVRERFLRTAPFRANTPNSITTAKGLRQEFARILARDYSEDREELIRGVNCLAVPVRNGEGNVVAGLALMAPVAVLPLAQARAFLPDLRVCAEAIAADIKP